MEADWEFEVGGDAPVIEAHWPGFVDLQISPERTSHLPETVQCPGLAEALTKLNAAGSPVWTSKCDFWPHLKTDEFDPGELDAEPGSLTHVMGCYIDLLPRSSRLWARPAMAADRCGQVCSLLHGVPVNCCRADLVIRLALIAPDPADQELTDLGITAYLTACGESLAVAQRTLQVALAAFSDAFCNRSTLE